MTGVVWVLVAFFVWFSSATRWEAGVRLGVFETQEDCERAAAVLDPRRRYFWDGMEGGPAWLVRWSCQVEPAAARDDMGETGP
ncbi:MAG: hypothetical protein QN141_10225 [Armatimonadota bacterium]|nr:hypothetical protein [Armatimonadota bacterium]MDR7451647.1 hypothetical protein [Armatimonadota bacterium]MDR7467633.1 hypothetical protein [Armatimonadota bacterium]MDR7492616.1 hypothetical protein [Armatimonadota bacterium]MDR7499916.1 hypothetical protein [Armatimonadota bacterium]